MTKPITIGSDLNYRSPLFARYGLPKKVRWDLLVYGTREDWQDETGAWHPGMRWISLDGEVWHVHSLAEAEMLIEARRIRVAVDTLSEWPWPLDNRKGWAINMAPPARKISYVWTSPHGHHKRYHVYTLKAWGCHGIKGLEKHDKVCRMFGIGHQDSPGSLGERLMHTSIKHAEAATGRLARDWTLEHLPGGLQANPGEGYTGPAYELDMRSAYLSQCKGPLPVGSASWASGMPDPADWNAAFDWYIARVAFYIPEELSKRLIHGVLGYRVGERTIRPTREGWYGDKEPNTTRIVDVSKQELVSWEEPKGFWHHAIEDTTVEREILDYAGNCYATRDEVELALELGYDVYMREGYGWRHVDRPLTGWADQCSQLLDNAPREVRPLVKLAIVAGIGRLAMRPVRLIGLPFSEPLTAETEGCPVDVDSGMRIIEVPTDGVPMPGWNACIVARTTTTLLRRVLAEESRGNRALAMYVDSITLARPSELPTEGWKHEDIGRVKITSRGIIGERKTRLPGIPRAEQPDYIKQRRRL